MSILPVPAGKDAKMNLSDESLLVILVVGIAAGWLAGQIVRGTGLGLGDLVVGIAGPSDISATWDPSSSGIVSDILEAASAMLLLVVIRFVRGRSRWGGSWGGVWRGRWW